MSKANDLYEARDELEKVLEHAEGNAESTFEISFVESIKEKFNKFGMSMFFSEKQKEILERISYKK